MLEKNLEQKLAKQESLNDQLQTELQYIDLILHKVGFERGLESLKAVAEEMLAEEEGLEL